MKGKRRFFTQTEHPFYIITDKFEYAPYLHSCQWIGDAGSILSSKKRE